MTITPQLTRARSEPWRQWRVTWLRVWRLASALQLRHSTGISPVSPCEPAVTRQVPTDAVFSYASSASTCGDSLSLARSVLAVNE